MISLVMQMVLPQCHVPVFKIMNKNKPTNKSFAKDESSLYARLSIHAKNAHFYRTSYSAILADSTTPMLAIPLAPLGPLDAFGIFILPFKIP